MRKSLLALSFVFSVSAGAAADPIIGAASTSCRDHTMLRATKLYELNKQDADDGIMHAFRAFMSGYNFAAQQRGEAMIDLKRLERDPFGARQIIALERIDKACALNPDKTLSDIFLMVIWELNAEN